MYISTLTAGIHYYWCNLFIYHYGLGVKGAAIATSITYFCDFALITLYVGRIGCLKESWFLPNKDCFKGLTDFMKVGLPSVAMLCLGWWGYELMTLLSGYISVSALAAQVIVVNIVYILAMIPIGF